MVKRRESNAERRRREKDCLATMQAASEVALLMEIEILYLRAGLGDKRRGTKVFESSEVFPDGEERIFTHLGERAYNAIGRLLCEYNKNAPKFLRMVADLLEGKEPYSSGDDWYDGVIMKAYDEACRRFYRKDRKDKSYMGGWPTFSEFKKVFREQNPNLHGASDRSLRRSLERKAFITSPDKRGRPREK
jgi:hypothetical protein